MRPYSVVLLPPDPEDGDYWLAVVPSLPGCMTDGPTLEAAAAAAPGVIAEWLEEAARLGRHVTPRSPECSGE
jgi:antitoxin HicB